MYVDSEFFPQTNHIVVRCNYKYFNLIYDGLYLNNSIINNISTSVSCQPQAISCYIFFAFCRLYSYSIYSHIFIFLYSRFSQPTCVYCQCAPLPWQHQAYTLIKGTCTHTIHVGGVRLREREIFARIALSIVSRKDLIECPIKFNWNYRRLLKLIFSLFQSASYSPTQLWMSHHWSSD